VEDEVTGPAALVAITDWLENQTWPDVRFILESNYESCYQHPNGFVVCRTGYSHFPGWQVRVHLWRRQLTGSIRGGGRDFEVHSHGFTLASKVVLGRLAEEAFDKKMSIGSWYEFEVENREDLRESLLRNIGAGVAIEKCKSWVRGPGSSAYVIPEGEVHATTSVGPGISVSLVCTTTPESSRSSVFSLQSDDFVRVPRLQAVGVGELVQEAERRYRLDSFGEDGWASFVFVRNADGDFAMARTKRMPEYWSPIGGRQKSGDRSPLETAVRELDEELGIRAESDGLELVGSEARDYGPGRVFFWLLELPTSGPVVPDMGEFEEFRWVRLVELLSLKLYKGTRAALRSSSII